MPTMSVPSCRLWPAGRALFLVFAMAAGAARAAYNGDFTSAAITSDFRYAMIGTFGSSPNGNNTSYWANGALRLEGRYAQQNPLYLKVTGSGSATDGYYSNDVSATFAFTYTANSWSSNTYVAFGLDTFGNTGANTYPTYRFVVATNTLLLQKQAGYSSFTNYATASVATLGSNNVYQFNFSAFNLGTNSFGKIVDVTASLYQNGSLIAALSTTDTPTSSASQNLGTSLGGGYIGLAAGEGGINTGTFRGIDLTSLIVTIPEPSAFLLLVAALGGFATTRRTRH